jgi:hypothetical protein
MNTDNDFFKRRAERFSQLSEDDRQSLMASLNGHHFIRSDELVISRELLSEVVLTLEHARKFITSKWISMHPDGVALYDECLSKLKLLDEQGGE